MLFTTLANDIKMRGCCFTYTKVKGVANHEGVYQPYLATTSIIVFRQKVDNSWPVFAPGLLSPAHVALLVLPTRLYRSATQ